jgi:hypothetical protein
MHSLCVWLLLPHGTIAFRVQFRSGLPTDVPPILSKMAERQRFEPTVPVEIRHDDLVVAVDADTGNRVAWAQIRPILPGGGSSSSSESGRRGSTGVGTTPQWNGYFPAPQESLLGGQQSPLENRQSQAFGTIYNNNNNNNNMRTNVKVETKKEKNDPFSKLWESLPGAKKDSQNNNNMNGGNKKDSFQRNASPPNVGSSSSMNNNNNMPRTTSYTNNAYDSGGPAMFNVYPGTSPSPGLYSTTTNSGGGGYNNDEYDPTIYKNGQPGYNVPPRSVAPQTYGARERLYSTTFDQVSRQQQQQSWNNEPEWSNHNNERNREATTSPSLWEALLNTREVRSVERGIQNHKKYDVREQRLYEELAKEIEYDKKNTLPRNMMMTPEARQRKARLQELVLKCEELDARRRDEMRRLEELRQLEEKKVPDVLWEHLVQQVKLGFPSSPEATPPKKMQQQQQNPMGGQQRSGMNGSPSRAQELSNQFGTPTTMVPFGGGAPGMNRMSSQEQRSQFGNPQNQRATPVPSSSSPRNTIPTNKINPKDVLWELTSVAVLDPYRGQGFEEELIRSTIKHHFSKRPEDIYVFTSHPEWFKVNFGFSVLNAMNIPRLMAAEFRKTSRLTPNKALYCCVLKKGNQILERGGKTSVKASTSSFIPPNLASLWQRSGK